VRKCLGPGRALTRDWCVALAIAISLAISLAIALPLAGCGNAGDAAEARPVETGAARNTAAIARERRDPLFVLRREEMRVDPRRKEARVVFLGDSITQRWQEDGRYTWNQHYRDLPAANFGINGDRTQNVLWRIRQGDLDGLSPDLIVLLVGTNNTGENSASEIVQGVVAILDELLRRLPETRVLLLNLFPKAPWAEHPERHRVDRVNALLPSLADPPRVVSLDLGGAFLDAAGALLPRFSPDSLHLSASGYVRWAEVMAPTLDALLAPGSNAASEARQP